MKEFFDTYSIDTLFHKIYDRMPQPDSLYRNVIRLSGVVPNNYLYGWALLNGGIFHIKCEKPCTTYNYAIYISSMLFYSLIETPDSTTVEKLDIQKIEVCDTNIQLTLSNGRYMIIDFVSDADNKDTTNE